VEEEIHMPEPDPNEEIKQKEMRAKQEASLLRAQADLVKAQQEYAAAVKPLDSTISASTAATARLDAQKGVLEAQKALSDARQAADLSAAQAAIGHVSASRIEGTVTVKQDAGKGEATLLASRAIMIAAEKIAIALENQVRGKRIVLLSAADASEVGNYRQFLLQQSLVLYVYSRALEEADLLAGAVPGVADLADAIPEVATAGVVIDAAAKLGSYFLSNYEIGGVALTADVEQLVSAVANSLLKTKNAPKVVLPARRLPQSVDFEKMIRQLADETIKVDSKAENLSMEMRQVTAQAEQEKDQPKRERLQQAVKLYDQATELLRTAVSKAEEFIKGLATIDTKGIALITRIAREKSTCEELAQPTSLALVVDVRAAVGGYYTKTNLWTFLGAMPFFAMGGAVVTYGLTNGNGELLASGLVPTHSGYAGVNYVRRLVAGIIQPK
jgi:hypothetical protein